jgi:murein DD-endopeptidase MepM/ murein hydrolase activator NlpD
VVASGLVAPGAAAASAGPATQSLPGVVRPLPDGGYGLSSYYGPRCMPVRAASVRHLGQDMGASKGTPVRSIARGTVVKAGDAPGFGQVVVIRHRIDGIRVFSVYGHVVDGDRYVRAGDSVKRGQRIADVGSSGTSTAPHLHLEIWRRAYKGAGWTRDPLAWMRNHDASLRTGAAWSNPRIVPTSCTYWTTTKVNLRSGPGTDYPVIRSVPVNRKLTATPGDGQGVWRRVTNAGTTGWMHANYVSPSLTSLGTLYVQVDGLRLRSKPSTSANIKAVLGKGSAVQQIWPSAGGWTKVYVGGMQGYVMTRYVDSSRP